MPCEYMRRLAEVDDAEFWERVLVGPPPADGDDDWPPEPEPDELVADAMCAVCGALGACAHDIDGRPLIHALPMAGGDD